MSARPNPVTITILEKAAVDNGFDQELPRQDLWLGFASTQTPLRLWLAPLGDTLFIVAFSQASGRTGARRARRPGRGTDAVRCDRRLHRRRHPRATPPRAACLSALEDVARRVAPRLRASDCLAAQNNRGRAVGVRRVGQDVFRNGLLEYWENRCAITGFGVGELLRASHIKPWADCASDAERLDVFNGFLLAPHLDAVFDRGFVTIADDGAVMISRRLGAEERRVLVLDAPLWVRSLADGHRGYLPWHRLRVFKDA